MRVVPFLPALAALLGGCGLAELQQPRDSDVVVLTVRNAAARPLATTVCGPVACSPGRKLSAGATLRFLVQPGNGTRTMVTAKRGDLVVAQKPVDFAPGDRIAVDITVP
jgi:hypothetical protein